MENHRNFPSHQSGVFAAPYSPHKKIHLGAIIAGFLTMIISCLLFSLAAISLGFVHFYDGFTSINIDSFAKQLTFVLIPLVSFLIGAFLCGHIAGTSGILHGFLFWAFCILVMGLVTTMGMHKNFNNYSRHAFYHGQLSSAGLPWLALQTSKLEALITTKEDEIKKILNGTDVPALNTKNIREQIEQAKEPLKKLLKTIRTAPQQLPSALQELKAQIQNAITEINKPIDKNNVVITLTNAGRPAAEAEQMAQQAIDAYKQLQVKSTAALETANKLLTAPLPQISSFVPPVLPIQQEMEINKLIDKTATLSLFLVIITALLSCLAGLLGAKSRRHPQII